MLHPYPAIPQVDVVCWDLGQTGGSFGVQTWAFRDPLVEDKPVGYAPLGIHAPYQTLLLYGVGV